MTETSDDLNQRAAALESKVAAVIAALLGGEPVGAPELDELEGKLKALLRAIKAARGSVK
jgi:hypothetical protein